MYDPCGQSLGCYIQEMVDSSKLVNEINIGSAPEGLDANFLIDIFESSICDIIHVARDDIRLELLKSALKFFKPGFAGHCRKMRIATRNANLFL